jgi:hypothetical protein
LMEEDRTKIPTHPECRHLSLHTIQCECGRRRLAQSPHRFNQFNILTSFHTFNLDNKTPRGAPQEPRRGPAGEAARALMAHRQGRPHWTLSTGPRVRDPCLSGCDRRNVQDWGATAATQGYRAVRCWAPCASAVQQRAAPLCPAAPTWCRCLPTEHPLAPAATTSTAAQREQRRLHLALKCRASAATSPPLPAQTGRAPRGGRRGRVSPGRTAARQRLPAALALALSPLPAGHLLVVLGVAAALAARVKGVEAQHRVGCVAAALAVFSPPGIQSARFQPARLNTCTKVCHEGGPALSRAHDLINSPGVLPLHAAGAAATEGAGQREVDVLLAVHAHHEAGDVDHLLADAVWGGGGGAGAGA